MADESKIDLLEFLDGHLPDFSRPGDADGPSSELSDSGATDRWSQAQGSTYRLSSVTMTDKIFKEFTDPFEKGIVQPSKQEVNPVVIPPIKHIPRLPTSCVPRSETDIVNGVRDNCTSSILHYAREHWVPVMLALPEVEGEGFPCSAVQVEELSEAVVKFDQLQLPSPGDVEHAAVKQPEGAGDVKKAEKMVGRLRIDWTIAASAAGKPAVIQANALKNIQLRSVTTSTKDAEDFQGAKHQFLSLGESWQHKETWFTHFKTLVAVEFKRYGFLKLQYFKDLAKLRMTLNKLPTQPNIGVRNLQHILRQAVHYCLRYGTRTILLSDYESMVLLRLPASQGMQDIMWKHFSTTESGAKKKQDISARYLVTCQLYSTLCELKQNLLDAAQTFKERAAAAAAKKDDDDKGGDEDDENEDDDSSDDQPPPPGRGSSAMPPAPARDHGRGHAPQTGGLQRGTQSSSRNQRGAGASVEQDAQPGPAPAPGGRPSRKR